MIRVFLRLGDLGISSIDVSKCGEPRRGLQRKIIIREAIHNRLIELSSLGALVGCVEFGGGKIKVARGADFNLSVKKAFVHLPIGAEHLVEHFHLFAFQICGSNFSFVLLRLKNFYYLHILIAQRYTFF